MTTRKALIIGSTGLVGSSTLKYLFNDPSYSEVTALVRKTPLLEKHRKLKEVMTNFRNLEETLSTITANDVFCCLGTTIKKAGSQEAFRAIDFSLVLRVAEVMREQDAEQFIVISAMGSNSSSRIFYNKVKGEMEESLKDLGYPCLRIIRPSFLLGHREEFRLAERIGGLMSPLWKLMLVGSLKKYRPVKADAVARFMVKVAKDEPIAGVHVYENNTIA